MEVLVTDGEQRAALAAVRSLGNAGHRVTVTSSRRQCLAGVSRYAAGHVRVPPASQTSGDYAAAIRDLVRDRGIELVLPVTDESLLSLLAVRDTLDAPIPFPSLEQLRAIGDKRRVSEAASAAGLAVPRQWVLSSSQSPVPREVPFPIVIKPHRSVVETPSGKQRFSVGYAPTAEALNQRLALLPPGAFPVLLQERVSGVGIGVFVLRWNGRLVARFFHRRLREKPPSGGVSVYRESVAPDPDLLERTERLLDAFAWNGVAMVEYKLDTRTGTPYIMEINGRLWGSLQLAIDAGVDFPALLVDAVRGAVAPPPSYRVGVRSRWFWGDVDQLLSRLRRSRAQLSLSDDAPGRLRAIAEFFAASLHPGEEEILRWTDPAPYLRETLDWFRGS